MSQLVFVGDESHSIVDSWMVDVKDSVQQTNLKSNFSTDVKSGLGFVEDSKKAAKPVDKFAQAMEKKNKNKDKRSRDVKDDDVEYEATHGLVEDMEESRTAIGSFVKKSVMKEQKKQKALADAQAAEAKAAESKAVPSSSSMKPEEFAPITGSSFSVGAEGKPKRVKTRSKQKNIRRDNRSVDNKPAHLQVGNKDYTGRPLTQETKKILGISKPVNNNNNRNNNNHQHNKGKFNKGNRPGQSNQQKPKVEAMM